MHLIQSIPAFLFALGVLIAIHEAGHFFVARWCGVKVLRFSIGMGKVIYSRQFGADRTEFALSILPLGGYVKMLDFNEVDPASVNADDQARDFSRQSVWKRMAIVAAGPIANFLLAILLFAFVFTSGIPDPVTKVRVDSEQSQAYQAGFRHGDLITQVNQEDVQTWEQMRSKIAQAAMDKKSVMLSVQRKNTETQQLQNLVLSLSVSRLTETNLQADFLRQLGLSVYRSPAKLNLVDPSGPGQIAGLREADVVLAVNQMPILDGSDLVAQVHQSPDKVLQLSVQRGNEILQIQATPQAFEQDGQKIGRLKVGLDSIAEVGVLSFPLLESVQKGAIKTWDTSINSFKMLGKMLTGEVSIKNISGPITIADYAGKTSRTSMISYIGFIALISISLGVMNLLPIPVLDGGHLLYYALEVLFGKPIPKHYGELAQRIGIAVLVCLMVVAFFNDIVRQLS